jgi:predicted methyltransferase
MQATLGYPYFEVYEFKAYTNVVPGYVIEECASGGSVEFEMPSPIRKTFYKVKCSRLGERKIVVEIYALEEANSYTLNIPQGEAGVRLDSDSLYAISREDGKLARLEVRDPVEGYLRLYYRKGMDWPTLYINGIHMHRIADGGPLADSIAKISTLRLRPGMKVLDTCMGLGYTALLSAAKGAEVYTVEVSENVIALAEHNPPSWLIRLLNVKVIHGDAVEIVHYMPSSFFDRIVHDPPRFEIAGELYSLEFYRQLYRILRSNGILFHYTGMPRRGRGRGYGPIVRGVIERLRLAGFHVKRYDERAQGVIAVKY